MLAVTDTGIGMTPEQMGKLFQEFSTSRPKGLMPVSVWANSSRQT
jgi:signal transduction histidine kinase